jgi:hypothetical protein
VRIAVAVLLALLALADRAGAAGKERQQCLNESRKQQSQCMQKAKVECEYAFDADLKRCFCENNTCLRC